MTVACFSQCGRQFCLHHWNSGRVRAGMLSHYGTGQGPPQWESPNPWRPYTHAHFRRCRECHERCWYHGHIGEFICVHMCVCMKHGCCHWLMGCCHRRVWRECCYWLTIVLCGQMENQRGISMDVVRWLDTVIGWLGVIIGWLDVNTGWLIVLCVQAESVDLGVAVVIEWLDRVTGWLSDVVIGWLDVMNDSWTDCIFFCRRRVRRVGCGCCQNHACMTWFNTSLLYSTMTTCGLPAMLPWF